MKTEKKFLAIAIASVVALVVSLIINPFAWNDGGERTVVQRMGGKQFVEFSPGVFYAGFFAKKTSWPNQISVSYQDSVPNLDLEDNSIEIGKITIRFGADATQASVSGITQYILPPNEEDMVLIHNTHRTPQSLVTKRLAPYTKECLQSSAQLMSSEMHYSGGRAQMSQDFIDQLENGSFLLTVKEGSVFDSVENESKRIYLTEIQKNSNGSYKRKQSSTKEYSITIADAQITDVDYEDKVDKMLAKKIEASTKMSVAKQELMTAQQQGLTSKAKGEQELIEIEYLQKKEQTKKVVTAETRKKVAQLEKEAAELENQKTKILADAESYKNSKLVSAGLTPQERAEWEYKTKVGIAEQLSQVQLPTTVIQGNGSGSGQANLLESLLGVKLLETK
jgi:hypothetical protein